MKVHIELDPTNPEDRAILERIFGAPAAPEEPPGAIVSEDLVAGRDQLRGLVHDWTVTGLFRLFPGQFRPAEAYIAACRGLQNAVEAVLSGSAALSADELGAIEERAREFVVTARRTVLKNGHFVPDSWSISP